MCSRTLASRSVRPISPLLQFHVWQFGLLVALTAIAIVDIQGYCREPTLIIVASAGYAGFAALCWLLWHGVRTLEARVGKVWLVSVYVATMGAIFLAATIVYLLIEFVYRGGKLV